jgi:hypothetical protein
VARDRRQGVQVADHALCRPVAPVAHAHLFLRGLRNGGNMSDARESMEEAVGGDQAIDEAVEAILDALDGYPEMTTSESQYSWLMREYGKLMQRELMVRARESALAQRQRRRRASSDS